MNKVLQIIVFFVCILLVYQGLHNVVSSAYMYFFGEQIHDYDIINFAKFGGFGMLMIGIGLYGIRRIIKTKFGQEILKSIKQKF